MKEIITDISHDFITEALSSPRMLEDLAAMEKYMSESYDGRTFIELLQNADDAESNRVKVLQVKDTLIIANDGRPFDKNDIMAICRSGASNKNRGDNIGYRGVGFKSATTIATEIIIHSANTYFTFSKSVCAKMLGKSEDKVPTVRIPFLFEVNELGKDINNAIEYCKKDGFTTFFMFRNAKIEKFLKELDGFGVGWLLFLKHVTQVDIECGIFRNKCAITRKYVSDYEILLSISGSKNQWYVVSDDNVSLAFKYDSVEGILPCGADEAVFHCFLPTLDKTGFPFKANADFSTDPSRKHIIQDESTHNAIKNIQRLFVELIYKVLYNSDERLYSILSLLSNHTTLNTLVVEFENGLLERLRLTEWVPLNNKQFVKPENAKVFPNWLTYSERKLLSEEIKFFSSYTVMSSIMEKLEKFDVLLKKLGSQEITIRELSELLTRTEFVQKLPMEMVGKIFVYCYRMMSMGGKWIKQVFIPTSTSFELLVDTSSDTSLNTNFVLTIKKLLSAKEIEELSICYDVFSSLKKGKMGNAINGQKQVECSEGVGSKTSKLAINKWKTPIQNCIAIETLNGQSVKDVSRKCSEYGVISTDKSGVSTYITVKNVGVLGDSFKLSEDEYSAAQQYGDNYKVYLFTTDTSNIKYSVVTNPVDMVHMKKVVKEWEWLCSSYELQDDEITEEEGVNASHSVNELICSDFDRMDGVEFERYCAKLLMRNGYEDVSLTKTSGDQGIDIIAYRDNIKYGIQCKCYSSDLGNSAVQEVFAGKTFYKCHIGVVLTNQHFSSSAIALAENNGIVLWGREMLLKLIKNIR